MIDYSLLITRAIDWGATLYTLSLSAETLAPPRERSSLGIQNMTYELALMKAGKGKVAGISGLDDGVPGAGKEDEDEA